MLSENDSKRPEDESEHDDSIKNDTIKREEDGTIKHENAAVERTACYMSYGFDLRRKWGDDEKIEILEKYFGRMMEEILVFEDDDYWVTYCVVDELHGQQTLKELGEIKKKMMERYKTIIQLIKKMARKIGMKAEWKVGLIYGEV
jgi:hypothetical protein